MRIFILLLSIVFCVGTSGTGVAQTKKYTTRQPYIKTFADVAEGEYTFHFKNINKIPYHHDLKTLALIDKLEKKEQWDKLLPVLQGYVSNFGIQNFYKDTKLLWRLGQLYERLGEDQMAKSFYRLILKHHRGDVTKILLYYDSITELDRDYFIPLEYYYELVEYRKSIDTLRPPRGILVNMGEDLNSEAPDYGPSLSPNDDILMFTSKRNRKQMTLTGAANEDIYISYRNLNEWEKAEPFEGINTPYNEGSAVLSKDGKTLYFTRCGSPQSFGNCDIFVAEKQENGKWANIRNLGANVNSAAWDSQPALSHSEDTLYFASDRIGGFGLSDIYFTYKQADGTWAPAQNMGPTINTRKNEVSPFYHTTYHVLYFSSDGHLVNFGDFDIFKSYYRDGVWQEPKNIGPLVNGKGSEYYFTIDSQSRNLYYARSEENSPNLDLYSFPLPMEAQPLATTHLHGSLIDSISGKPFTGIVSIIDMDNGIEIAPKALRRDGSFDFDLIKHNNYMLIIQGDEFFRIEDIFYLNGDTSFVRKTESISSKKLRFTSLEFNGGSSDILPDMEYDLNSIFNFLIDNPRFRLRISGHTDSKGDKELNMKLSKDRATAIKLYLTASGQIETRRIEAEGFGDSKPIITPERTEEDRRTNRRVEFEILPPKM
jgi:flagellar motor protein MotB